MLDNTSNNDTFVDGIEHCAKKAGVPFNASWARLCCMPHTIHLAAIKLCSLINSTWLACRFMVYSSLRALVLFQAQRAGKLLHVQVTTKKLPWHHFTATLIMMLQLKMMVAVKETRPMPPISLYQVLLFSKIRQKNFVFSRQGNVLLIMSQMWTNFHDTCSFEKLSALSDQALRESSDG